ncbi:TDP-N-acetylfucosamine:lipid II N-acetylfucosaminyltransferase [Petrotoga sp. Shatin.DS.tank11.9.2.9.3]|uniref:TDP-N-acetylfucosamine:lipid II N-acetylfucosaminyltransferase n=1 Tax=Petrotoga sp. Shatin.DS.tank11.9.2.9.3 TaxID=1469556 RepID=UPI000EF17FF2|nr:TDP-N-acetylfucosamine:lipid II N-acetylfucosaminyltransferase [Petrotoga sp. Shatin.DS.tank11.9.2.9.3]
MYEEIFELINKGEINKAQEQIEKISDDDPKKYNLKGLIHFNKKELEKAKEQFEKGLKINPVDSDLLFNYGYLLKEMNQEMESWRYLMRIHDKDWATYDLLGDIEFKNRSKLASLRFYLKAAELTDNPQMKKKFLEIRNKIKKDTKIAFLCLPGLDNFLKDIVETFSLGYDVKLVVSTDVNEITQAIKWADIVWLEWANELAVFATNKVPEIANKKVICRLHRYEAFTQFPEKINWRNIDRLIFVANSMKLTFHQLHLNIDLQSCKEEIVYNGVDLDKFKFSIHKPGYNLAVLAHINYRKNPETWIQIIGKLKDLDNKYKLHVGGDFQDPLYKEYFEYIKKEMKMEDNFILHGWINNVEKFLEDKNYIISTSIHEGYPYNIIESMARGIKPVILNYSGSKEQWPNELIYNTIDEAVEKITEQSYDSESYRRFIEDNYSLEQEIYEIEEILNTDNRERVKGQKIPLNDKGKDSDLDVINTIVSEIYFPKKVNNIIIHIFNSISQTYSEPFFDFIEKNFPKNNHCFIVLGNYEKQRFKRRKNLIILNSQNEVENLRTLLFQMKRAEKIFIHSLFFSELVLFLFLQSHLLKKSYWVLWGGDLYYHKFTNKNLKFDSYELTRKDVIKNFGHIVTLVPGDYYLAKKWYKTEAKYHYAFYPNPVNYSYLDKIKNSKKETDRKVILVGNSADPANKHTEILNKLSRFKEKDIEIITPLSYGDQQWAKKVYEAGKNLYGEKYKPLLEFLSPEEYGKVLNSVDIAIFNHDRQQAIGNILALLYLGKKVFIKSDITPWDFFKEKGLTMFDTYGLDNLTFDELIYMDKNLRERNREIIAKEFSEEKCVELWKNIFES